MGTYYDRVGNPISYGEWSELANGDRRVSKTTGDAYRVSTVYVGLEYGDNDKGRPLIYETMVFPNNSRSEVDCRRYATREEAEAGHSELVELWINQPAFD